MKTRSFPTSPFQISATRYEFRHLLRRTHPPTHLFWLRCNKERLVSRPLRLSVWSIASRSSISSTARAIPCYSQRKCIRIHRDCHWHERLG